VVVQGIMSSPFLAGVKHAALESFYKGRDGAVTPMPESEFHDYD